ncbi:MAG TPA: sigma-70 family RNA polymerase sigma factor [Acidimicrobiia bacterium]|nr:sigma-70 family RNA polymerase sigma factor [Acidimicrobiia bacterium]
MSTAELLQVTTEADQRFESLFRTHHQAVLSYCRRRMAATDAEDVAADVFAVAWRRLDDIPEGEAAKAWLMAVAYMTIGNHRRGSTRRLSLGDKLAAQRGGEPETPETRVASSEEDLRLLTSLEKLRASDQEILKLVAWDKVSHAQIATVLGISVAAVDQRVSRARSRLKKEYEKLQSPEGVVFRA